MSAMSQQSPDNDSPSTTVPGLWIDGQDVNVPPPQDGEVTAPLPLPAPALDLELDLNLDLAPGLDLDITCASPTVATGPEDDPHGAMGDTLPLAVPAALLATAVVPPVTQPVRPQPQLPRPAVASARVQGAVVDQTAGGTSGFPWQDRRVLVVSADAEERVYLRARLALARLVWVDEAVTTTQAESALNAHRYMMAIFNLDSPVVDGLALAQRFHQACPEALCVVTGAVTPQAGLLGRWRQWRRERALQHTGVEWLDKPLLPKRVALLFARAYQLRILKKQS